MNAPMMANDDREPIALSTSTEQTSADERLSRIESVLSVLAARSVAGPPPAGFSAYGDAASTPLTSVNLAVQAAQAAGYLPGSDKPKRSWKDWPIIREVRLCAWLYFDRRYSPSRAAHLGVPAIILACVLNYLLWYWFFKIPLLSDVFEHLGVMVLGVVLYRVLAFELDRYAAVLDYLKRTKSE
jgi:hypothetical protein